MNDLLEKCILNFGKAPRKISLIKQFTYFRVPKPNWFLADQTDDLKVLFKNHRLLFKNGVIVWGHTIQANQLIFEDGKDDCPGEVVYSLENSKEDDYKYLKYIAHELYKLKGTQQGDPELVHIANYLTNQYIRVFGLPVPSVISPKRQCYISTTYFLRKHLPNRKLYSNIFPLIVNPKYPHEAIPLPERYWPPELIEWWLHS